MQPALTGAIPADVDIDETPLKLGPVQRKFLEIAILVVISVVVATGLGAYATSRWSTEFVVAFTATILTIPLYVVRYYAIAIYYKIELEIPAMATSILVATVGAIAVAASAFGSLWLLLYGLVLLLACIKQLQTLRAVADRDRSNAGSVPQKTILIQALSHERDTAAFEAALAAFVLATFAVVRLNLTSELGIVSGGDLLTWVAVLILIYVVTILLAKLDRFSQLLKWALQP